MTTTTFTQLYYVFRLGEQVGYRRAQLEGDREFLTLGRYALDGGPSLAELERRRTELPETTSCACPPCALRRAVVRRRGGDYAGAGSR